MNSKSKITIAHVGAFKKMSKEDSLRWMRTMVYLTECMTKRKEFDPEQLDCCHHKVVNLKYGKDFLLSDRQYDIVVLHSIFQERVSSNLLHVYCMKMLELLQIIQ